MSALLTEMTRQPTPNKLLQWHLSYIPPKHLRLPGYDYGDVEETDASAFEDPRDPAMLEDDAVSSPDSKTVSVLAVGFVPSLTMAGFMVL